MKRIELGLHAHHARLAAAAASEETAVAAATSTLPTTTSTTTTVRTTAASTAEIHTPFAKINSVAEGSPAAEAGMQAGDYIKKFGWVHALNHEKLKKLTECVAANDGVCNTPPSLPPFFHHSRKETSFSSKRHTQKGGYVNSLAMRVLFRAVWNSIR